MEPQDTIFLKGRDIADPAERAAYLAQACGNDADLRQRVEAMLRDATGADEFFGPEPAGATVTEGPGTVIGRYKLLQKIGEGGMGVVYMAEQREPVIRKVALKIIKLGMDTRQVVARFEAERQALALMDHPNIAKVLDGGATESGRPYFVMDLVPGLPITQFCDEANLSTRERLDLFLEVCSAIQHAHQKGIIHRDLKPSNILVTLHGDKPVPKVIDFGVAKVTAGRLTEKTLFTQFQQFIGTPAYMSPEQASLSGLDIDTRSDIYGLGVLLYELLTGRTPFDGKELLKAGLDEMRRTIRETEPPRPSNRISTLQGEDLTTTAQRRRTDPPKLVHLVRGDLDWIVMKALEKDRARRYETANGLAMDIMRHLTNEPIVARPPSRLYEFQKTVQRHKFGFGAAAVLIAVLAVGVLVSTLEAVRARRAEQEQSRLRQQAQTEAAKSEQVAEFLKDMLRGVGPSRALGRDTTMLREILDKTTQRIGKDMTNQPEVEAELRSTIGFVYDELAEYDEAEAMQRSALAIRKKLFGNEQLEVADSLYNLGYVLWDRRNPKDMAEAEALHREALRIRIKLLGTNNPVIGDSLTGIADVYLVTGKAAEAEPMYREALAIHRRWLSDDDPWIACSINNLADDLFAQGKLPEAETLFRQALAAGRKSRGNDDYLTSNSLQSLADTLSAEGKLAEAESAYREALESRTRVLGPGHPATLGSMQNLADVLQEEGKLAEAESTYREALARRTNVLGVGSPDTLGSMQNLAVLLLRQGRMNEAEQLARSCLAIAENKLPDDWQTFSIKDTLGIILVGQKKYPEAEPLLVSAYEGMKQREDKIPLNSKRQVKGVLQHIVQLYEDTGRTDQAAEWQQKLAEFDKAGTTEKPDASKP